ncbi:MAG: hypothetical protein Q4A27_01620 [bacterium]|nr:hypothetical protein [bacterium]
MNIRIYTQTVRKEFRYRIMSRIYNKQILGKKLRGSMEKIYSQLGPFLLIIWSESAELSLADFEKEIENLVEHKYLVLENAELKITALGERYVNSLKGETIAD